MREHMKEREKRGLLNQLYFEKSLRVKKKHSNEANEKKMDRTKENMTDILYSKQTKGSL